jgi:DNA polymerase-1
VLYVLRGVSEYRRYDEAGIFERTGVTPKDYPQYAALRGDPSDNLPGVPGVGEKTAAKLINTYGDLDGVFANLDKNTPKLRENLAAHETQARKNAEATPLLRDVPIECDVDELKMGGWDVEEVKKLFTFLEFRTLWDRLVEAVGTTMESDAGGVEGEVLEVDVHRLKTAKALAALDVSSIAGSWQGEPGRSPLEGVALVAADGGAGRSGQEYTVHWADAGLLASLAPVLTGRGPSVDTHDAKPLMRSLAALGVDFDSLRLDTALAAYLVEPAEEQYPLEKVALKFANLEVRSPDAPPAGQLDLSGSEIDPAEEAGRHAVAVQRLHAPLSAALEARGLSRLYDDIERPLVRVLARMEDVGVRVDTDYLRGIVDALTEQVHTLDVEIQELAGHPFVVNSTKQLRTVLFDELGLQPQKKTKTGFSTDAQSLEKLKGQHPIIEKLLRYREVEKLRSTYGESLLAEVGPDGRIHATFQQTVARTGRLSSDRPNLHNIPIRTEEGRQFRRAFIPDDGWELLIADYNQIELRVIAHLAEDPGLIEAFTSGADIHTTTASRIYSVEPGDVSLAQRSKAKMVSYGLAYGMEAYGLSQRLNIPVEEAALILGAYFDAFPNVKAYMERTVAEARERGYTETLFGRRRQIPELSASNFRVRQAGERQAMNAGIQGLAADIFKAALVRLDRGLEEQGLRSRVILQVHDEVVLEVPPGEHDAAPAVTLEAMQGACELCVGLEVNLAWGQNWAEAKG